MKSISLRFLLLITVVILLLANGSFIISAVLRSSYEISIDRSIVHYENTLKIMKNIFYSSDVYDREEGSVSKISSLFIEEIAKKPGVVFVRIMDPKTNRIIYTSISEEEGVLLEEVPFFYHEVSTRMGEWNGEDVIELSMSGGEEENIWIGVSLSLIMKEATSDAFSAGARVLLGILITSIAFYIVMEKIVIDPIFRLRDSMAKVGKGNFEIKMERGFSREMDEVFSSFNNMIDKLGVYGKELKESQQILEVKVKARTKELQEMADNLESEIKKRTDEMQKRVDELEKFHRLTVGRELRMKEVKEENEKLKERIKKVVSKDKINQKEIK